uniref:Uncharacterized protein n=1 Tax=Ditylenchus dipsaci TaxID=166011 RepID=A0A915CPZ8_9BILA
MGNNISANQHQVADSAPRTILETGGPDGIIPVISASNQQLLDLVNSRFNQLETRISQVGAKRRKPSCHHPHHRHHHHQDAKGSDRALSSISSSSTGLLIDSRMVV